MGYLCGIDVGSKTCKLVILDGTYQLIHQMEAPVGGDPEGIVEACLKTARKLCKLKKNALEPLLTGRNGADIKRYPRNISELKCLAAAAHHFNPLVRTIIDAGAFTNKCLKIDEQGAIVDYMVNDICSSGSGMFLELVCKSLDLPLDQLGTLAMQSDSTVPISSQCSIFAESEVIYLMNEGKSVSEIAAGVCNSIVGRMVPLISRLNPETVILLSGGVGRNPAIQNMLTQELNHPVKLSPFDPVYVVAFGAAILSAQRGDL